jgi:alpha-galactosidase
MSFIDILRSPDGVMATTDLEDLTLHRESEVESWQAGGMEVETRADEGQLKIRLSAPRTAVKRLHLRWSGKVSAGVKVLGDHWERGYGDLEWRGLVPERTMPWYVLVYDGRCTHGYGVKTGAASIASWRIDGRGISLWLDVRAGGVGVQLGQRQLEAATVVARQGATGESPFRAAVALCRLMCERPLMPRKPVYGSNNWYYAYGRSSREQILDDSRVVASLSPDGANRPFMVIDDGWQIDRGRSRGYNGGPWDAGNDRFPDMAGLAAAMRSAGARPGVWVRPLWIERDIPESWLFEPDRINNPWLPRTLDPTIPPVRERVAADIRRLVDWGFELIKHDFTTFDICGHWGFEMHGEITPDGWSFADSSRTTAEVILDLYRTIRQAAGDALVLGCNTIGHLGAGLFELQRTGDDTSGIEWERTRQRGVNTLAFRACQHGTFFAADADCVGLTDRIHWEFNRQWLDLLARSGTPLFVSADPKAIGPMHAEALKRAFETASRPQRVGEPLDWLDTTCPSRWRLGDQVAKYDWYGQAGTAFSYS